MKYAPFKTLLFPYKLKDKIPFFAIFKKRSENHWQALSGSVLTGESTDTAVVRYGLDALGISSDAKYFKLDSRAMIPFEYASDEDWEKEVFVIPEDCFAILIDGSDLLLSEEIEDIKWLEYKNAIEMVKWDSNKTALWELNFRLKKDRKLS